MTSSDHKPVIGVYDASIIAPLNMKSETLNRLTKNAVYILQISYMEVNLDQSKYSTINPTLLQKKSPNSDIYISFTFEENDLVNGDKSSALAKLEPSDPVHAKINLRGSLYSTRH